MKVEFQLSFEDFLESRGELQGTLDNPRLPLRIPGVFFIIFAVVALISLNWISAAILLAGLLIMFLAIGTGNFFKQRAFARHLAALRADFERFSSGAHTFEANDKSWHLLSVRDEQVHSWDEVQMVRSSDRLLYLMTCNGACTLPKTAFTPEQLAQIEFWYKQAMSSEPSSSGFPEDSSSIVLCKFGSVDKSWRNIPYEYPGVWAREKTTGPDRLVIAPANRHISLLLELSKQMAEPFGLLYILIDPRGDAKEGRYESPLFVSREDMVRFLNRFGRFLESDGRHDFWIRSIAESDLLVYDQHNVIYAYGCLDQFRGVLTAQGLKEVPKVVIPCPHSHFFHEEFDRDQNQLLSNLKWEHSPLQKLDEA